MVSRVKLPQNRLKSVASCDEPYFPKRVDVAYRTPCSYLQTALLCRSGRRAGTGFVTYDDSIMWPRLVMRKSAQCSRSRVPADLACDSNATAKSAIPCARLLYNASYNVGGDHLKTADACSGVRRCCSALAKAGYGLCSEEIPACVHSLA